MTTDDESLPRAVRDRIARFFLAFDDHDWPALRDCLAGEISVDYSDLRGDPPRTITADDYVAARAEALAHLDTLHSATNFVIELGDDDATCHCSALIQRTAPDGRHFDTAARYTFTLRPSDEAWHITAIQQSVLWNRGDPTIHSGAQQPTDEVDRP